MKKQRIHREWFRTVSLSNRKSCPTCDQKLGEDSIWSWGNYVNARWHTVKHFCDKCFLQEVKPLLEDHQQECGCSFEYVARNNEELTFLNRAPDRVEQSAFSEGSFYLTRAGDKVKVHKIEQGTGYTFPIKGTVFAENRRPRYQIWRMSGKTMVDVFGDHPDDLVKEFTDEG